MKRSFDSIIRLRAQVAILREVAADYPHRTIENVIDNIESRIKAIHDNERRADNMP